MVTFILLCVSNFILYIQTFRGIMKGFYKKCIRFSTMSLLFVLLMIITGLLFSSLMIIAHELLLFHNIVSFLDNMSFLVLLYPRDTLLPVLFMLAVISLMGMFIMQIVMLRHGISNTNDRDSKKWLYISFFMPIIGSIGYLYIGRNKYLGE